MKRCEELNKDSNFPEFWVTPADAAILAEALVAELAKENEPVYAFRRKGLNNFCTCDKRRYNELVQKPALFEVRVFYTLPPTAEQIEQETAEAIAKMVEIDFSIKAAEAIRSGTWKEYK